MYTNANAAGNRKQKVLAASLWDALHVAPNNIAKSIAKKCIGHGCQGCEMHDRYRLSMTRLQQAPHLQRWWVPFTQMAAIPRCTPHPSTGLSTRVVSLHSQVHFGAQWAAL